MLAVVSARPRLMCALQYNCGTKTMFVVNLLVAARKAWSDRRRRERVYAELMSLDDRSLADIGIHRSQIPGIVEGLYHAATARTEQAGSGARHATPSDVY